MASQRGIGVGIVGYGLAGRSFHAPFIAAVDGLDLTAIATTHVDRRAQATAEHPAATIVDSLDALLERPDVEVVVVAAPNRAHVPIGRRALEAGRHVVVDKPIAMDVAEAESLIETAARARPHPVRLPEPALGRRLPDRQVADRRRCAWAPSTASRPASNGGRRPATSGVRRPRRPAVRTATWALTSSTRASSCSDRSSACSPRSTGAVPVRSSRTRPSSRWTTRAACGRACGRR